MWRRAKHGLFYFPPRSLLSVQVRGTKAVTSPVAILKSAALDASVTGWMVDWTCPIPPQGLWIAHGKSAHSGSNRSCGNPAGFPAGPGQAPCWDCCHTAASKATIKWSRGCGPQLVCRTTPPSWQPAVHFEDSLVHDRKIWKWLSQLNYCAPSANLLCRVGKGESCWIRTVPHCKVLFFWS